MSPVPVDSNDSVVTAEPPPTSTENLLQATS